MKVKIIIFIIITFIFTDLQVCASNRRLKKVLSKANELVATGNYIGAANVCREELYRIQRKKNADFDDENILIYQIANCYRLSGLYSRAEKMYQRLIRRGAEIPKMYLYFGDCQRSLGNIEEARTSYYEYKELRPDDLRWTYGLKICDYIEEWSDQKNNYSIKKDYFLSSFGDDFSPCVDLKKEYLYMTKTHRLIYNINQLGHGEQGLDLYRYKYIEGKWTRKERLNKFNSDHNEFGTNLGAQDTKFFFTRSFIDTEYGYKRFEIMCSENTEGVWDSPERLTFDLPDSSFIRNCYFYDKTQELYFESNMSGGIGKIDIWKSKLLMPGVWGDPENLGPEINTAGNDINPVFSPNGNMYLACDRRIGMGGYDVFKVVLENGEQKVQNVGYPLNSTENDVSISFTRGESEGFIISDRGFGLTNFNVWAYNTKNPSIEGSIIDIITDEYIGGVKVELLDADNNIIEVYETLGNGYYYFDLQTETDYVLRVSRKGYFSCEMPLNQEVMEMETHAKKSFRLMQINSNNIIRDISFIGNQLDEVRSKYALANLLYVLRGNPDHRFELRIYTDLFDGSENIVATKAQAKALQSFLGVQGFEKSNVKVNGYGHTPAVVTQADANMFENIIKSGYDLSLDYIRLLPIRYRDRVKKLNQRTELLLKR